MHTTPPPQSSGDEKLPPNDLPKDTQNDQLASSGKPKFTTPQMSPKMIGLFLLIVGGFLVVFFAAQQRQDTRDRASSPTGTATVTLEPATSTITAGSNQTIELRANTQGLFVDGFQFIATITGDVPSDLTLGAQSIQGLNPIIHTLTDEQDGKKMTLVYLTSDPSTPYTSAGADVTLGVLSFTAPQSGSFTIVFNPQQSKITQTETAEDVLLTPASAVYTVQTSSGTTTATPSPTEVSTVTSTPTPTAIVTISATPTPTSAVGTTVTSTPTPTTGSTTSTPTPTTVGTTATPTPTPTESGSVIPNPPFWWEYLPENLRNFLELLYLWIFVFQRPTTNQHLLEGIVSATPTPTPAGAQ